MKIYIEHKDGVFYDASGCGWDFAARNPDEAIRLCPVSTRPTDKRDFEIGARVYFQSVGWTEVIEKGTALCHICIFSTGQRCVSPDDIVCAGRYFKTLEDHDTGVPAAEVRTTSDYNNVDHPKHYTDVVPGIECIQVTEHFDFLLGNAIKYIWRSGRKGENTALQDLKKAEWYIKRAIEREERTAK